MGDPIRDSGMYQWGYLMARGYGVDSHSAYAVNARSYAIDGQTSNTAVSNIAKALLVSDVAASGITQAITGEVLQGSRGTGAASAQAWFASVVNAVSVLQPAGWTAQVNVTAGNVGVSSIPTLAVGAITLPVVSASQTGAWTATVHQGSAGATAWPVSLSTVAAGLSFSAAITGTQTVSVTGALPVVSASQSGVWTATVHQGSSGATAWPITISGAVPAHSVHQGSSGATAWPVSVSGALPGVTITAGTMTVNVNTIGSLPAVNQGSSGATAWPLKISAHYAETCLSTQLTIGSTAATTSTVLGTFGAPVSIVYQAFGKDAAAVAQVTLYASATSGSVEIDQFRMGSEVGRFPENFYPYCMTYPASATLIVSVGNSASIHYKVLYRTVSTA